MRLTEFQLIDRFFRARCGSCETVVLGVGDDAAVVRLPPGMRRVGVSATLTARTPNVNIDHPRAVGHRALSSALNKLAALGGAPAWMTLALTLSEAHETWLGPFSEGMTALAERCRVALIGGDTTRGPFTVTIMVDGLLPEDTPARDRPRPGDLLCVSGTLGTAANALIVSSTPQRYPEDERRRAMAAMEFPEPRGPLGEILRKEGVAAADLGEGLPRALDSLLGFGGHGAVIAIDELPAPPAVREQLALIPRHSRWLSLIGDHELLISLPASRLDGLRRRLGGSGDDLRAIGLVRDEPGVRLADTL